MLELTKVLERKVNEEKMYLFIASLFVSTVAPIGAAPHLKFPITWTVARDVIQVNERKGKHELIEDIGNWKLEDGKEKGTSLVLWFLRLFRFSFHPFPSFVLIYLDEETISFESPDEGMGIELHVEADQCILFSLFFFFLTSFKPYSFLSKWRKR